MQRKNCTAFLTDKSVANWTCGLAHLVSYMTSKLTTPKFSGFPMNNGNSPLEYLAAFAITFVAGMLSAVTLAVVVKRRNAADRRH